MNEFVTVKRKIIRILWSLLEIIFNLDSRFWFFVPYGFVE